jgi:phenylacetate-CoA ligase
MSLFGSVNMHAWTEKLYYASPVLVQNVMLTAYGWHLRHLRQGGAFRQYLAELVRHESYTECEVCELQTEQLQRLIRHCYDNVPYYASLLRDLKLHPRDFRTLEDLGKIPVLEKEIVRRAPEQFHAVNFLRQPREMVGTSGTTGTTLRIWVDREGRRKNYAFFARAKRWAGVEDEVRTATFAGRPIVSAQQSSPPFWRYNLASSTMLCSSYHLSATNIPFYVQALRRWRPLLIDSYPSSVTQVAKFAEAAGVPLPRPRAIITSSETLAADQRELVEKVFRARIFDQYGSAEQACFVSQCERSSYHVHPDYGILEYLPSDMPGVHRVVATGFTNYAMPFLRYETGDLVVRGLEPCACGRNFPTIRAIMGRMDDILVTPDGRRIGRLDPVFKGLTTIRRAQIVQQSLNCVQIRIERGDGFCLQDEESIRHELEKRLGKNIKFSFEFVAEIPAGPGGKFRSVISNLPRR